MKLYGPYTRKDGRKHVIHYDGQTRRTQSYPRYLMEQELGRELEPWEHIDHKNDDHTDDSLENFQILTQLENNRKSNKGPEWGYFICHICGIEFKRSMAKVRDNQNMQKKRGPYCSKICAGKAGLKPKEL